MGIDSKLNALKIQLCDLFRELGVAIGTQLPAERELAKLVGVGRTALRPALLELESEGVIERRIGSGTFLVKIPAPRVPGANLVLITPYTEVMPSTAGNDVTRHQHEQGPWLQRVVSAVEKSLSQSGASFRLFDQSPRADNPCSVKEMAKEAAEAGADAVILLHPLGSRDTIACALGLLHDRGVHPLIVSARNYSGLTSQVYFDSGWGAYCATRHLLDLGHRHIGFAGASAGHEWVQERLQGYRQALGAAECELNPNWIWIPQDGERIPAFEDGAAALQGWISLPEASRPTAVVAANDVVALGILQEARRRGIEVPHELSVVGFDNQPETLLKGLTTVERPTEALGETVARVALERLRCVDAAERTASVTHRLRPLLIERATTARPQNI